MGQERGGDKAEVLSYFSIGVYFKGKKNAFLLLPVLHIAMKGEEMGGGEQNFTSPFSWGLIRFTDGLPPTGDLG